MLRFAVPLRRDISVYATMVPFYVPDETRIVNERREVLRRGAKIASHVDFVAKSFAFNVLKCPTLNQFIHFWFINQQINELLIYLNNQDH